MSGDEREIRDLHRLELELSRDEQEIDEEARTVQHDTSQAVHLGQLGVLRRRVRIVTGSVRRLIGRVGDLEEHAAGGAWSDLAMILMFVAGFFFCLLCLGCAAAVGMVAAWGVL